MASVGPCTARCHSWYWIANITKTRHFKRACRVTQRGVYHCRHCTAKRYGELR